MYSPRIPEEHIPALYHLAKERCVPMTRLVARAVAEFLDREQKAKDTKEGNSDKK